jgi:hypothetical protein
LRRLAAVRCAFRWVMTTASAIRSTDAPATEGGIVSLKTRAL